MKKKNFDLVFLKFFDRKIHKQVGRVEALQLADAH